MPAPPCSSPALNSLIARAEIDMYEGVIYQIASFFVPDCAHARRLLLERRSGEGGDELGDGLAAAGVERDLDPGVAPRVRAAQVPHQVDDPVELVGLEREHPLVVA